MDILKFNYIDTIDRTTTPNYLQYPNDNDQI